MSSRKTVFVGMSGGVDSSVSAYLLQKEGYNVIGVFIKVWHPDFLQCHWEEERLDAMRVSAHLGIPFLTCNAEEEYKRDVADYFIEEYKKGRTPNPDVMCNTHIKFGRFFEFASDQGADMIATGHYARVLGEGGALRLARGTDTEKDQSYFLWNIDTTIRDHILFPIGHLTKKEVRKIAQIAHLPTAVKGESQGICFLGHVDIPDFLSHYMDLKEGDVLNKEGVKIGRHRGAQVYTVGQRHGFSVDTDASRVDSEPYFVIDKDIEKNSIVVSHDKPVTKEDGKGTTLVDMKWQGEVPKSGTVVLIQTRYRQKPVCAEILSAKQEEVTLRLDTGAEKPTSGQSCVLYDKERVVGGGIILIL